MLRAAPLLALACVLLSCSDDPEPVAYLEHCGVTGPIRTLELEPGQVLSDTSTIGDRVYYEIGRLEIDPQWGPGIRDVSLWSTGPCGESPARLVDGFLPFTLERWPDVPLTCLDDSGFVALDPRGAEPPRLLFPAPGCRHYGFTNHGLIVPADDGEIVDLQLVPYPDDPQGPPAEPVPLIESVQAHVGQFLDDELYVITADATLVHVDLPDGTTTPVQADVASFQRSADGRYLLWTATSGSVVSLRDNETGTSTALGTTSPIYGEPRLLDGVVVVGDRLFILPQLTVLELPRYTSASYLAPDRSFALLTGAEGVLPWLRRIDLGDGTLTTLFTHPAQSLGVDDEALTVFDLPACCTRSGPRDEGEVWRVPLDGSPARRLADRASDAQWTPDADSLVTVVDLDPELVGTLIRVDTDTRSEQTIDDHVIGFDTREHAPSIITYTVNDGPRSGVYTARLATTP